MIRRGFTLVELLTTIGIIALLAALLVPAVGLVRDSTRKTATEQRLTQIGNAIEAYVLLTRRQPDEQGVAWSWDKTTKVSTPAWIKPPAFSYTYPASHRECLSTHVSGTAPSEGLADVLERQADLQVPGEAFATSGPVDGLLHLVDGWGQPLRYQRISEAMQGGVLAARASWWLAPGGVERTPPPAIGGKAGEREGFVLYSVGKAGPRLEGRDPGEPQDDTAASPGRYWAAESALIYRKAGQ